MEEDRFCMSVIAACIIVGVIIAPVLIPVAVGMWALSKVVGWGIDRWL